jgi:nucleotide-binding universal stress UspA family protein
MDVLSLAGKRVRAVSIRNILLATDGSAGAHRALTAAADLSRRSGAALHLVTAYEFAPSSVLAYAPYIGPESAWDAFETDARKLLDNERGRLTALGASVDGMYVARDPAFNAVMDVAQTVDADLVVVGSRELDALRRTLVGSVSEHVVHSVHRPVLVVRRTACTLRAVEPDQDLRRRPRRGAAHDQHRAMDGVHHVFGDTPDQGAP